MSILALELEEDEASIYEESLNNYVYSLCKELTTMPSKLREYLPKLITLERQLSNLHKAHKERELIAKVNLFTSMK